MRAEQLGKPFRYNEQSHLFRKERIDEHGWSHSVRPHWSHDPTDEWIIEWLTEAQVDVWITAHQPPPPLTIDDTLDFMVAFDLYEWPALPPGTPAPQTPPEFGEASSDSSPRSG